MIESVDGDISDVSANLAAVKIDADGIPSIMVEGALHDENENEVLPVQHRISDLEHQEQMFIGAVSDMNVKLAEDIISSGVDVNCRSKYKHRTALHELVSSYFAQYNYVDYDKLKTKFVDMLGNLIHYGIEMNATESSHQTALHLASCYPHSSEIITALISSGVDANVCDDTEQTALHKAVVKATVHDVRALVEGGANLHVLDAAGNSPLHLAAKRKFHSEIIKEILSVGSSANIRDDTSRMRGSTALHLAVKRGNLENVKALIAGGANVDLVDGSGQSPIHLAAGHDITGQILDVLHQHGGNLNDQDAILKETPLHKALKLQMWDNIKFLSDEHANPNLQDHLGESPLHKAASVTSPFVWTTLTRMGGDVWLRNRLGETPLDKALRAKNMAAVTVMREHLNTTDN